jgi:hypothetical protein
MRWGVLLAAVTLAGCQSIETSSKISEPLGRSLTAGVGDVVLRVDKRENMPNIFGKADLFGRTRPVGADVVQYAGMQDGKVVFIRSGVSISSTATTMNSTPLIVPTVSESTVNGSVGRTDVQGTITQRGTMYIPARGGETTSIPTASFPIVVDWHADPRLPIAGQTIVIDDATPTQVTYHIL